MTPHMEAIAFRIWQVAEPKGWDLTASDIGEAIDVDPRVVGRVAAAKGWNTRLRTSIDDRHGLRDYAAPRIYHHGEMGWI